MPLQLGHHLARNLLIFPFYHFRLSFVVIILLLGVVRAAQATDCAAYLTSTYFPTGPNFMALAPGQRPPAWPKALAASERALAHLKMLASYSPEMQRTYYSYHIRQIVLRNLATALNHAPAADLAKAQITPATYAQLDQLQHQLFRPKLLRKLESELASASAQSWENFHKKFTQIKYRLPSIAAAAYRAEAYEGNRDFSFIEIDEEFAKTNAIFQFLKFRLYETYLRLLTDHLARANIYFIYRPYQLTAAGTIYQIQIPRQDFPATAADGENFIALLRKITTLYAAERHLLFEIDFSAELQDLERQTAVARTMALPLELGVNGRHAGFIFHFGQMLFELPRPLMEEMANHELARFPYGQLSVKEKIFYRFQTKAAFFSNGTPLEENLPGSYRHRLALHELNAFEVEIDYLLHSMSDPNFVPPSLAPFLADRWEENFDLLTMTRASALDKIKETLKAIEMRQYTLHLRPIQGRALDVWVVLRIHHPLYPAETLYYYGQTLPLKAFTPHSPVHPSQNLTGNALERYVSNHHLQDTIIQQLVAYLKEQEKVLQTHRPPAKVKFKRPAELPSGFDLGQRSKIHWHRLLHYVHRWWWFVRHDHE